MFAYSKLNSTFLLKFFFQSTGSWQQKYINIYKVNCNLKLSSSYMKFQCFIFFDIYNWRKECPSLSSFLYCWLKTIKLFNKCAICYFYYTKNILNNYLFKEYINPVVFINLNICCHKNNFLFQLVVFKICVITKAVYCLNWFSWTSTWNSHWEVFLKISLNQKTLKL